ncbi:MAG: Two component transcriptional regulator, AraC family [Clostridia bacterium]|jgi:two-component system response regulator YesN|nr:Two component transcriptional regulator, AraC family [Clostridia bacterium]
MLNILIVDDEEPARETFKYLINWEETGFQIGGFAQNGSEAFEKYKALTPDLVITDIQMPIMDGLDLIKKIRHINKNQKFVILTCHENFNYAKEAIRLGVSDYLLKDLLTAQDLYSLLEKVKDEIEGQRKVHINPIQYNEDSDAEEYKAIILKKIMHCELNEEKVSHYCEKYHFKFHLNSKYKTIFGISIDDYRNFLEDSDKDLQDKRRNQLTQHIEQVINEQNMGECYYDGTGTYIAVVGLGDTASEFLWISTCYQIAVKLHRRLVEEWHVTATIGISQKFSLNSEMNERYNEVIKLIKYKIFLGKGKTIFYNMRELKSFNQTIDYNEFENRLKEAKTLLFENQTKKVIEIIESIYDSSVKDLQKYEHLKQFSLQLIGVLLEYCSKNEINYKDVFLSQYIPIDFINNFETIQEMREWLSAIFVKAVELHLQDDTEIVYTKHVKEAITYMEKHYASKIGLSSISEKLGVNKAYFCRVFKQETKENFTDYLNNIRIEKAKDLILNSDLKLYEIAEKVGFTTLQHFNNNFKKIAGVNPLKYKNMHDPT